MFEASLINYLKSVSAITDLVGTYAGSPAIFSYEAPENADLSYITIRIESNGTTEMVADDFIVFIDYYDFNKSRVNCIEASKQIKYALQGKQLIHAEYNNIRFEYFSGSFIEDEDTRDINYNLQFSARAITSGFMIATS